MASWGTGCPVCKIGVGGRRDGTLGVHKNEWREHCRGSRLTPEEAARYARGEMPSVERIELMKARRS